jgi:putative ABC transport system permease protein
MDTILQDVRYALRMLRNNAAFSSVVVLTLAFVIGANTAMFSVMSSVLLKPLPYPNARRLVQVEEVHSSGKPTSLTTATFLDLEHSSGSLTDLAAYRWWTFNLTGDAEPESVQGALVSAGYFSALRLQPVLGRVFSAGEDTPANNRFVVLGYSLWQRRYSSDPHVIGRQVKINGNPFTIIGVLPAGFHEPFKSEIWAPLVAAGSLGQNRRSHLLTVIGRLTPSSDLAQASSEARVIAQRINAADPSADPGMRLSVSSLQSRAAAPIRPLLVVLMAAVICVLLIACANLANLFLGRGLLRSRELAIRTALGAGRLRLVRQLLAESALLSLAGAAMGIVVARVSIPALQVLLLSSVSGFAPATLDAGVLLFAAGITLFTAFVCGLAPALQASRRDVQRALSESSRGSASARHRRLRDSFVVSQVALALVLLVGAGLLIESFSALLHVPLGFNPQNVLTMRLFLSSSRFPEGSPRIGLYFEEVVRRLNAIPGVSGAAFVGSLPFEGGASTDFAIAGHSAFTPGAEPEAEVHMASAGYFRLMGISAVAGREFTSQDTANSQRVMLISQSFAREFFPNEDPLGHQVTMKDWGPDLTGTIVGVVADVKRDSLEAAIHPAFYWPNNQFASPFNSLVIKTSLPAAAILPAVRAAIWSVDPEQTISNVATMEEIASEQFTQRRFSLALVGTFAGLALLLASLGIYAVIAQSVSQRTREIGIRVALGAQSRDVATLVLRQGFAMVAIGVALGVLAAAASSRLIASLLFGVHALNAGTFLGAALILLLVALLACWLPIRRACSADPLISLRAE